MHGGSAGVSEKYGVSPLAAHDRALKTAGALLLLDVAREVVNFELRRQHGFTEGEAAKIIREAAALVPRPEKVRQPTRRRSR
jgi:hypothetical protein